MNLLKEDILTAAEKFGTPLYLYDGDKIRHTYRALRAIIPRQMDIFYSMKANPLLGLCQLLKQENSSCEVCSEAELHLALKAGFSPENIIFVGPGKSIKELELCIKHRVYAVVCESLDELICLNNLARRYEVECAVLLRINPCFSVSQAPLKMGGKPTQFGIDVVILQNHIKQILCYSNIKIRGIHIYNGTRILKEEAVIENTIQILNLADKLSDEWGLKFECIDIGGGFGIPYFKGEKALNLNVMFNALQPHFNSYLERHPHTRFILESGRYLVGESGVLVTRVMSTKVSHQEEFVITDGGMNCHLAATGLGSYVQRNFPIDVIPKYPLQNTTQHSYNITGPLCTPGDVFAKQITLPEVNAGDLVIVKHSGAYGASASPGRFLSHGFPAEALWDSDELHLLKRRETVEDMLSVQHSLKIRRPEWNLQAS